MSTAARRLDARTIELKWLLAACGLAAALFVLFPAIDLLVSGGFVRDSRWLLTASSSWLHLQSALPWCLVAAALGMLLAPKLRRQSGLTTRRATLAFLATAALLGPFGLIGSMADHSGRARPTETRSFGGKQAFTPAFIVSRECARDCSFVSRPAAQTALVMTLGWFAAPAMRRRWLIGSAALAALSALPDLLAGRAFLSDVVFAWFAVYFSTWISGWLLLQTRWFGGSIHPRIEP